MATSYPRDIIGYGANPPHPQWPHGARLALNFVLNYEEGSEASFADGDGYSESGLTESGGQGVQGRDLAAEEARQNNLEARQNNLVVCLCRTPVDEVTKNRIGQLILASC